ncbi:MAG: diguanylate cyclase, partial [Rhodospirillaceae bacterium]|nr:diguanylate cyclase [Rhodospirillaceae bacterium]
VIEVLNDFVPELILLDLYMPNCEGHEVAAIIRQQEAFDAIPIVFLSSEHDVEKQLSAMELGGDDFLTKPIQPKHLISAVRIRASRFRELRSMMVKDSMTSLYNHTTTKQLMRNEIERAKRTNQSIAMASLDIDNFKKVNDIYGHAVGDKVIKSLSRLLRQRLRGADIIGRMGGEEFAALLTGATAKEAELIFNQIRQAFSEIVFHSGARDFSVTLSCGIAEFPAHGSVSSLSDASDRALYAAKNGGRNLVMLA